MKEDLVYHYTSLENFYSIIKNNLLWLPSFYSSNDICEDGKIKDVVKTIFNEKYPYYPQVIDKKHWLGGEYYVTSFTKNRDSDNHFSQYANNGKGVCIGFDRECLNKYFESLNLVEEFNSFLEFQDVIYDKSLLKKKIENHIKRCKNSNFNKEQLKKLMFSIVINKFESLSKINNFEADNEVRLLFKPKDCNFLLSFYNDTYEETKNELFKNMYLHTQQAIDGLNLNEMSFECMSGQIRKVYKLSLKPLLKYKPINEIILGPRCSLNKNELLEFLRNYGFNIKLTNIKNSKIKLRN